MNPVPPRSATRTTLDAFFSPRSVVVIGATDKRGSVGRTVLLNLLNGSLAKKVYAVNPKRTEVLGVPCFPTAKALPESVDLAMVVTPATTVPGLIGQCVDVGVKAVVVISAGFKERGPEGADLERQIREQLGRGSTRLIGPNCLGIMNPVSGLDATFAKRAPKAGNVAFLSQSGALLTAILDWAIPQEVGFSGIVSTGSMLDVGWGDLISHSATIQIPIAFFFTWNQLAMPALSSRRRVPCPLASPLSSSKPGSPRPRRELRLRILA